MNLLKTNNDSDFSLLILEGLTGQKGFDMELAARAYETISKSSIKTKNETNQSDLKAVFKKKLNSNPNKAKNKNWHASA